MSYRRHRTAFDVFRSVTKPCRKLTSLSFFFRTNKNCLLSVCAGRWAGVCAVFWAASAQTASAFAFGSSWAPSRT
eukprot:3491020-Rhodomonas_salina.1